ncbi:hypothetical protein [Streptomyces sp. NPDC029674]|uniref:hypothetical protein n=1 Tax=Streptomyces sp. NPDC029674 TaxID=3365297 RepID=UPI00384A6408
MRADGAYTNQIREFEQYAKQLEDPAARKGSERIWGTVACKLIVAGIRHGGTWLGKIVGVKAGVPTDIAKDLAHAIMLFVG